MKKITTFAILIIALASCSKSDDQPTKCFEFFDLQGNIKHEQCNITEREASNYYLVRKGQWTYRGK